ncbi:MAG: EamA family transporter RarD [Chloroflexi bacterium SZAS-1]|nr:EamA family transporter RarD [Chloroflexi bacterium SZAS-1]
MKRGMWYATGAYIAWGFLPVFWKSLHGIPALEILSHRVAWGLVVALVLLAVRGRQPWIGAVVHNRRTMLTFVATAALLSLNWFVYIWAVNAGYIVETSLGYFINPLVNVLLGRIFLNERLRTGQAVAIAIAFAGVLYLTVQYGALPWIALVLAGSFAGYGLLRKTAALGSLEGFTLETMLLFLPALGYLLYREAQGVGAFGHAGLGTTLLLMCAGVVTAVPLLLFAAGARRISFTLVGILQYIAPTIQFLLGVLVYGEHLDMSRLIGFMIIWAALAVYTLEGLRYAGGAARLRAAGEKA